MIFKDSLPLGEGDNRYYLVESESWPPGIYHVSLISDDGTVFSNSKAVKIK